MLADLTVKDFLAETAGSAPVPGGGSIAALNGAIALALGEMVANLTIGKKKYAEVEDEMRRIAASASAARESMLDSIDLDSEAYDRVFAAFKLPKETEAEKTERTRMIQEATKEAAYIPMDVARKMCAKMELIKDVARKGNRNAVTDACVAMMNARTCVLSALLNVRINLLSIRDEAYVDEMRRHADQWEKYALQTESELLEWAKTIL